MGGMLRDRKQDRPDEFEFRHKAYPRACGKWARTSTGEDGSPAAIVARERASLSIIDSRRDRARRRARADAWCRGLRIKWCLRAKPFQHRRAPWKDLPHWGLG